MNECSICLDKIYFRYKTECNHVFHKNCIVQWLETQNSCPVCRNIIKSPLNINDYLIIISFLIYFIYLCYIQIYILFLDKSLYYSLIILITYSISVCIIFLKMHVYIDCVGKIIKKRTYHYLVAAYIVFHFICVFNIVIVIECIFTVLRIIIILFKNII